MDCPLLNLLKFVRIVILQTIYRQCVSDNQEISTASPVTPPNITSLADSVNTTGSLLLSPGFTENISSLTATAVGSEDVCTKPQSYVSETTLAGLWHVVYWTCQALTWLVQ